MTSSFPFNCFTILYINSFFFIFFCLYFGLSFCFCLYLYLQLCFDKWLGLSLLVRTSPQLTFLLLRFQHSFDEHMVASTWCTWCRHMYMYVTHIWWRVHGEPAIICTLICLTYTHMVASMWIHIQLLEYHIPAAARARHKNRQVPISRKPIYTKTKKSPKKEKKLVKKIYKNTLRSFLNFSNSLFHHCTEWAAT